MLAGYMTSHARYGSEDYPPSIDVCWKIKAESKNDIIKLSPIHFDLETTRQGRAACTFDYVQIHCGRNGRFGKIDRYCGNQLSDSLYSADRFFYVTFITDGTVFAAGFNISYKTMDAGSHKSSCTQDGGLTVGTLIGFVFIGVLGVCVLVSLVSCCVKGNSGSFTKCRMIRNTTRSDSAVHPITYDDTQDLDSNESTPEPIRRYPNTIINPPSYSEAIHERVFDPVRTPPPVFTSTTTTAVPQLSLNQNNVSNLNSTGSGTSRDVTSGTSSDVMNQNQDCLTAEGTVNNIYEYDANSGSLIQRPETADYIRPPSGDPLNVREYMIPNSPPPAYQPMEPVIHQSNTKKL